MSQLNLKPKYKIFQETGHATCYRHGLHSQWSILVWRGSSKVSCRFCQNEKKRRRYAQGLCYQKKPSEKCLKWFKDRTALCSTHGQHSNWRYSKGDQKLVCKICHRKRSRKHVDKNWWKTRIQKVKASAKIRDLEFNLTEEFIRNLFLSQKGKCGLTDRNLDTKQADQISLDRIDSSKGYIEGNVWWTHIDANYMKLDFSMNELVQLCKEIVAKHGSN